MLLIYGFRFIRGFLIYNSRGKEMFGRIRLEVKGMR